MAPLPCPLRIRKAQSRVFPGSPPGGRWLHGNDNITVEDGLSLFHQGSDLPGKTCGLEHPFHEILFAEIRVDQDAFGPQGVSMEFLVA